MYFLKRNYETSLTGIPEDAHRRPRRSGRTLQYDALLPRPQESFARRQITKLYLRFKADESVDAITGIPRRADADVNRERQRIHEHTNSHESLSYP